MPVNIAVIGYGYWGPNLVRNFSLLENSNVAYICDCHSRKHTYIETTTNYKDVLSDVNIDAVAIATPAASHFELAMDALLAGKHVLVEKPITITSKDATDLVSIAKQADKILMVDHTFEYSTAIAKMKDIVESGELGEIYYLRADWLNLGILQPDVNVIWDLATHVISIIGRVLGNKVKTVSATASTYVKNVPEIAHVNMGLDGGVRAFATVSWLEPKKTREITIVGSKKTLAYDLMNTEEPVKIYNKRLDGNGRVDYRHGDTYCPAVKNVEPLKAMCSHFIDCIETKQTPISDGASGLSVVKVLEATEESLKGNGKVITVND